jgi:arylsulfatase A-like enzyme
VRAQDPEKPFFIYFSTGCSHAPHQVQQEGSAKYKGKFDQGWDKLREETFALQKPLGVIPADAELTPRNDAFPAWDSLPDDQKKLFARQMEVYAGYQENADWNVGRVLDALEEMGELDNTLVLYIWGDNGASMEGTLTGSFNELTMQNGLPLTPEQQLALIQRYGWLEVWGTDLVAPHYSAAWAWAGNTPFQWGQQVASHLGGTRNPLAIRWPKRIKEQGGLRTHFTHCIDIGPTILDIAGIPQPTYVDGIEQQPMHGVTFADSLEDANAPEHHTQKYFDWQMNTDKMGVYGNFYLKRAIITMVGLGANQPEDSVYPICVTDADGKPLHGDNNYMLHFDNEDLPLVGAFWSVTMYDAEGFQAANPINRFATGDRDALRYNADGSLDIYMQHNSPGPDKESNWLAAPRGPLGVTTRLYAPELQVVDGHWAPPAVKRV